MKQLRLILVLFVLALAFPTHRLLAAADLTAGVLTVTGVAGDEDIQLQVGPAPGEVVVLKAPGVVEGTRFSGVHTIKVASGPGTSDKVEIKAELNSDMAFIFDTDRGGDVIKLEMKALANTVNASVTLIGITGLNVVDWSVYSQAQNLGLALVSSSFTGIDNLVLKVESPARSQRLAVNLAANTDVSDDNIEMSIKSAAAVVDLDVAANMGNGYDKVKVELDQLAPATITADFAIDMSALNDSAEIVLKGNNATTAVNGWINGATNDDSLVLFVEGAASGAPVLDGGLGHDSCKASLGTLVACE